MSTNKNPIWNFFERNKATAKCKFCCKNLSLGSQLPKKQTTISIKRHLEICHPEEYKKLCEEISQQKIEAPVRRNPPVSVQQTLQNCLDNKEFWSDDSLVAKNIDKSIMDLILVDMLPYNMVEGAAFQKLNFADPEKICKYKKKCEKYFRTTRMPETYTKIKEKVFKKIQNAEWVSFTTDIWTNPSKSCSLLSFTAHFIDGPNRQKLILGASVLKDDHTGQYS